MKRIKRKADEEGGLVQNDDVQYPKVLITEVLQPTNALKKLAMTTKFGVTPFYEMNDCRNMLQAYITANSLDKVSDIEHAPVLKGGLIRIDPNLYAILHPKPPLNAESIRKDAIFISISNCTNSAYVVSQVDPNEA